MIREAQGVEPRAFVRFGTLRPVLSSLILSHYMREYRGDELGGIVLGEWWFRDGNLTMELVMEIMMDREISSQTHQTNLSSPLYLHTPQSHPFISYSLDTANSPRTRNRIPNFIGWIIKRSSRQGIERFSQISNGGLGVLNG